MSLLEELETLLETRQPYANGNAEKSYPLVAELIQQLRSAKQSVHLTGGESAEQTRIENELSEWGNPSRPPTSK